MFSEELTKTAELLIEKGKVLLQKGAMIKLARAESIKRAEIRKQEELRRKQEETQHYHCYELVHIPQTLKEEKIDDEMSIIPRDPYDPFPYFDTKDTKHFYVKEEAFSCSSAEDGEPDIPIPKKQKQKKEIKASLEAAACNKRQSPYAYG